MFMYIRIASTFQDTVEHAKLNMKELLTAAT